jgi:hypothetical protein
MKALTTASAELTARRMRMGRRMALPKTWMWMLLLAAAGSEEAGRAPPLLL